MKRLSEQQETELGTAAYQATHERSLQAATEYVTQEIHAFLENMI